MPKTYADLVRQAISIAGETTPAEPPSRRKGSGVLMIAGAEEFARGVIAVPLWFLARRSNSAVARAGGTGYSHRRHLRQRRPYALAAAR